MSKNLLFKVFCIFILQFGIIYAASALCLHPSDWKDPKACIEDIEIPCDKGFYNFMTEGDGYGLGSLPYEKLRNFFCKPCIAGYYCPGDNKIYRCPNAEKPLMTECPEMSEAMQKNIERYNNYRPF